MTKETALSLILAIGIIAGSLWIADRSLQASAEKFSAISLTKKILLPGSPPEPASGLPVPLPGSSMTPQGAAVSMGISKCKIDGKTVYSNQGCPADAQRKNINLHDSAGIVSPRRESLAELTASRQARENAAAVSMQQPAAVPQPSECPALAQRIESLDAMARQPQSAQMQDRLRQERVAVRDRQRALSC